MMQHNLAVDILGVLRPPEMGPCGVALPAPADSEEFRDMLAELFQPAQEMVSGDFAGENQGKAAAKETLGPLPATEPVEMPEYTALDLRSLIALQVTPELVSSKPDALLRVVGAVGKGESVATPAVGGTSGIMEPIAEPVRLSAQPINVSPGAELSIDLSGELYAERVATVLVPKASAAPGVVVARTDPLVRQEVVSVAVPEVIPGGEETLPAREMIPAPQRLALELSGSEPRELTVQLAVSLSPADEIIPAGRQMLEAPIGRQSREVRAAQLSQELPVGQPPRSEPVAARQTPEILARAENGEARSPGLNTNDPAGVSRAGVAAENAGKSIVNPPVAQERAVERLLRSLGIEMVEIRASAKESASAPARQVRGDVLPSSVSAARLIVSRDVPLETPVRIGTTESRSVAQTANEIGSPEIAVSRGDVTRNEVARTSVPVVNGAVDPQTDKRGESLVVPRQQASASVEQARMVEAAPVVRQAVTGSTAEIRSAENMGGEANAGQPTAKTAPEPAKAAVAPDKEALILPKVTKPAVKAVKGQTTISREVVSRVPVAGPAEPNIRPLAPETLSPGPEIIVVDGSKPLTSVEARPVTTTASETVAAPLTAEPVVNNVEQKSLIRQPLQGKSIPELVVMGAVGEEIPLAVSRAAEPARGIPAPELIIPPAIDSKQAKPAIAPTVLGSGEAAVETAVIVDQGAAAVKIATAPVPQTTAEAKLDQKAGREAAQEPATRGRVSARGTEVADFKATLHPQLANSQEIPPAAQVLEGRSNPIEGLVFKVPYSLSLAEGETMVLGPILVRRLSKVIVDGVRKEHTQIRLQLRPPSLGKLNILLRVEEGQLVAHMQVTSRDVKAALMNHIADLQASLQEQDVNLARFTVDVTEDFGAAQSQADPGRGRREAGTPSVGLPGEAGTEAPELLDRVKMGINAVDLLA